VELVGQSNKLKRGRNLQVERNRKGKEGEQKDGISIQNTVDGTQKEDGKVKVDDDTDVQNKEEVVSLEEKQE